MSGIDMNANHVHTYLFILCHVCCCCKVNNQSVCLSATLSFTYYSPDVTVYVAQRRHEFKCLGELYNLQKRHATSQLAAATFSNKDKKVMYWKILIMMHKNSQVNRCPLEEAQSSVHTAGGSELAAWSSWRSSPGQSAPQTDRWPPPAEPVPVRKNNHLHSLHSVDM